MKKGLNTTQLKIIAIIAMAIDHTAWGFVDMFSATGQVMHTIGRLTIPIMSFFIAEGYRRTSNLKRYIYRMMVFSIISVVPFYLFFGEEYGYRQNFIFDLLLALLTLTVIDSKKLKKPVKIILATLLFITSAVIGGWPVLPICFVLTFYYGKSFKQKCILISSVTCFVECFVITFILLNNTYHFSHYEWRWYEFIYFLGFMLALPLLNMYNGEKGKYPVGKYFFFSFYPMHFLVLFGLKQLPVGNYYMAYLLLNLTCFIFIIIMILKLIFARPSRALVISVLLGTSCLIYTFGFLVEIMSSSLDIAYAGTCMEYFGECIVFLCFMLFMSEMCHVKIPTGLYIISGFFSVIVMYLVMTTRLNHLFYTNMSIDSSGPFTRLSLEYGPGFFTFFAYMFIACGLSIATGIKSLPKFRGVERRRIQLVLIAVLCPWLAYALKLTGLTHGYEVSAIGVLGSLSLIYISIITYGYFDSVQLAGENALHYFGDGIMVVDTSRKIIYVNKHMQNLYPDVEVGMNAGTIPEISDFLEKSVECVSINGGLYDTNLTPLEEHGFIQGYMVSIKDMSEHYEHLRETERYARTDSLTGLSNRTYFKSCFYEFRENSGLGAMLMLDVDNFKSVNDNYGHGVGDKVLMILAKTMQGVSSEEDMLCRIGGDEFCMFLKNANNPDAVGAICERMICDFSDNLKKENLEGITSISVGAAFADSIKNLPDEEDYRVIYKNADAALYDSKENGKNTYRFYTSKAAQ